MIGARRTELVRYRASTHPRVRPEAMSHQRQPDVHPKTRTEVRAGNQFTIGKARSGPARTLTACLVEFVCCANAESGNSSSNDAKNQRFVFVGDRCIGVGV